MAKTDWKLTDEVTPDDMNQIGIELNAKETPEGAQDKADQAEQNSKDYTDQQLSQIQLTADNVELDNPNFNSDNVDDALTELFQNVSSGKTSLAAAITDMGQSALGSMTFAQLAAKIKDISKDANALVGDVESGKTFYQGGVKRTGTLSLTGDAAPAEVLAGKTFYNNALKTKRTGTMVDRPSGNHNAGGISRSGNTLRFAIPAVARYGTGANIQRTDNNWIEANIKSGIQMFGKTGTLKSGAVGQLNGNGAGVIEITGLGFTPSYFAFYRVYGSTILGVGNPYMYFDGMKVFDDISDQGFDMGVNNDGFWVKARTAQIFPKASSYYWFALA